MSKNLYSFPRRAENQTDPEDRLWEQGQYSPMAPGIPENGVKRPGKKKKKVKKGHIYYDPMATEEYREDPATVAEHFMDRTQFPHGI